MSIRCPIHNMPDCSPLLNGCSLVNKLWEREESIIALKELKTLAENWKKNGHKVYGNAILDIIQKNYTFSNI